MYSAREAQSVQYVCGGREEREGGEGGGEGGGRGREDSASLPNSHNLATHLTK